jgi:hypothetical protein
MLMVCWRSASPPFANRRSNPTRPATLWLKGVQGASSGVSYARAASD